MMLNKIAQIENEISGFLLPSSLAVFVTTIIIYSFFNYNEKKRENERNILDHVFRVVDQQILKIEMRRPHTVDL